MVNAQTVAMITVGRATEGRGSVPATIKAWGNPSLIALVSDAVLAYDQATFSRASSSVDRAAPS